MAKEPALAAACADDNTNASGNPHLLDLVNPHLTRRHLLRGGLTAAAASILGGLGLAACDDSDPDGGIALGFTPVSKSLADQVAVPSGYAVSVLYATGDPIDDGTPDWSDAGTESGASYEKRAGDHHDGLYYFGLNAAGALDRNASDRGLLCINHEAQNAFNNSTGANAQYIHPNGATLSGGVRTVVDEVVKEINCHGVSVLEIARDGAGKFGIVKTSAFNRRVTAATVMDLSGPVRGSALVRTKFSADGTQTRGTVNNCANGYTPWGTYLTCEENWNGYFARAAGDAAKRSAKDNASLARYGRNENSKSRHLWETAGSSDDFRRWDMSVVDGQPEDGTGDYRHGINTFGWVVEIDPADPASTPRKRTALGRFAHEGAWPANVQPGRPVVFYMGDDSRNEYIYKFVSAQNYDPADSGLSAGDKYLDDGRLFVAKFNADGTGQWLELKFGQNGLDGSNAPYAFADQADVLVNARLAADKLGATKMDRPEWAAVHPVTGEVYFTLTNTNIASRPVASVDAANPRAYRDVKGASTNQDGNSNGHIIRWREAGDDASATAFTWDVYVFGAQADADAASVNLSGLVADNDFSSPDGLWFGRETNASAALLWIQTDDGAYTDVTNCMLLAAIPGRVGDGASRSVTSTIGDASKTVTTYIGAQPGISRLRRFLVGPKECEITGIDTTPDGKTLFVNIQHPGEDKVPVFSDAATYGSRWPGNQFAATHPGDRPRSATLVITKNDGGIVGL